MKERFFAIVCLVFGLISSNSAGQQIYTNDGVEVHKLDNNIYLLKETYQWTANIIAITGIDGILLFDSGFKDVANDLVDAVEFLGKDVSVIINSHLHYDHIGGNEAFGKGVKIIGHTVCKDELPSKGFEIIAIDEEYSFEFSQCKIICIPFPRGHSQCDIIVYVPDLDMVYLGDLYLSESFPLVAIGAGSKAQTLVKNLKEILEILPNNTRLFSGHGKETNMSKLADYIKMLETTIELVRAEMKTGKSIDDIKDSDLLKDFGQWGKFFDFITKETWIEQIYLSYK